MRSRSWGWWRPRRSCAPLGLRPDVLDPDEAASATRGMVVAAGGALYRDVVDRKPPPAPLGGAPAR